MPITVSIPLAALFGFLFVLLMGDQGWGFFAGFGAGYVAYDMMHYAVHHCAEFEVGAVPQNPAPSHGPSFS